MSTYTQNLTWPRSDGDESSWPTGDELAPKPGPDSWWKKLDAPSNKIELWETKIGKYVAEKKGVKAAFYRMPLPEGYAIFEHHKGDRVDCYVKGCPSIGRKYFRSPAEFQLHADWLLDTSRPLNDHSTCECLYNNASAAAQAKKVKTASTPGSSSKPRVSGLTTPKNRKRERSESSDEEKGRTGITPERAIDMKTFRRFRKGELVWFRIDTIHPPAGKSSLRPITHWPGLVANMVMRNEVDVETVPFGTNGSIASSSVNAALALGGGKIPAGPKREEKKGARHTFEHHIRPLGFFSNTQDIVKDPEDMLPWAMCLDVAGSAEDWSRLGQEGTRIMRDGIPKDLAGEKQLTPPTDESGWEKLWRNKWGKREPFREVAKDWTWETAVYRFSVSLMIAKNIMNSWTQTDKIEQIDSSVGFHPEDLQKVKEQKMTLYEGLWWGGERIWIEDMVRLRKQRSDLPSDSLGAPSPGSQNRAVTMRIRMITIEISPDSTPEQTAWRCLLHGDVFELVAGERKGPSWEVAYNGGMVPIHVYPAPKGYSYKQLNAEAAEVTVDIMDVAGRIYPNLLDPKTQRWFGSSSLSAQENKGRVTPGELAHSLEGMRPGTLIDAMSEKWKEDLYTIVIEANRTIEKSMSKYYETLVMEQVNRNQARNGLPTPPKETA